MAQYIEPFPASTRGDEFGNLAPYRQGRPHRGQDWAPGRGKAIPAITSGTIKEIFWTDGLGWNLTQSTTDGLWITYSHLLEKPNVSIGKFLHVGKDYVGKVGDTGELSTGDHLHVTFARSKNPTVCPRDKLVDPLKHIAANPAPKKPAPKPTAKKKK